MLQLAIPVFVLMTGAAFLGFIVAWTWRRVAIQTLESELIQIKDVNFQIESERQNLVQHTNLLESEKQRLLRDQSQLDKEKKILTEHLNKLSAEKKSLEKLLERNKNNASQVFHQEQLVELEKKLAHQREEIEEKEIEIKNYRDRIEKPVSTPEIEELKERFKNKYHQKKSKWEEKYRNLNFKLLKVARERDELKKGIVTEKTPPEPSERKQSNEKSLDKIKRRFSEWQDRSTVKNGSPKTGLLSSDYGEILNNPGDDTEELIDELQLIPGINKTIEQKLNALGVYRYEQISRLEEKDILLINKILDLDPKYISKNEWVTEATKFKKK